MIQEGPGAAASFMGPGVRWAAASLYGGLLIVLALVPSPAPYVAPGVSDSVLHATGYGVLALLVAWAAQPSVSQMMAAGLAGIAGGVGLGIVTELLQGLIPWRDAELRDVGWDLTGAVAGAVIWLLLAGLLRHRQGTAP